jgi:hypothetical protein
VGGDRLDYSCDVATSTADITTFKILINSTLSTANAEMMMMDIKNYYLGRLCVTSHSQPLINTKYKIPINKLIVNNN